MSTDVVEKSQGGAVAAAMALKGKLAKTKASMPQTRGAGFMSFGRDGLWSFGKENNEVFDDDRIAINPMSIQTGFIAWTNRDEKSGKKNEVVGEVMVPLGGDVPLAHALPEKFDPDDKNDANARPCVWKEQFSCKMKVLDGEFAGQEVVFATTSVGGLGAMNSLLDQIMLQIDEAPEMIVPVVSLQSDHYMHKQWGKTYVPVVRIKDWLALDDTTAPEPAAEESNAGETGNERPAGKTSEPRKRARPAAKEPEVEDAVVVDETSGADEQPEEPARRRRRR